MELKIKNSRKGVSLPIATGLVTLLMVASLAANELIIRTIRSVRSVEASNRAYFAAEAGTEDALYELSPHLPGYQTPLIDTPNARKDLFDSPPVASQRWKNQWDIESRSGVSEWPGKMFKDQKLVISLYSDNNYEDNLNPNAISNVDKDTLASKINGLNPPPSNFSITFSILTDEAASNKMKIDNDQDGGTPNEDGPADTSLTCRQNPEDADCDGKVDEDSDADPVILWKLSDNNGRSLIPLPGCIRDPGAKTLGSEKSELCERDFVSEDGYFKAKLDSGYSGRNQDGVVQKIDDFISSAGNDARMQFEFLIVAPMEYVDSQNKKQPIQSIDYTVNSGDASTIIPYPYFIIKSDGYYGTYKQSITTTITPKTSVPLFDFTIIQQQ